MKTNKLRPSGKKSAVQRVPKVPSFPIVGIGASAGGLEAFTQLLGLLPPDTGMAFVLIQHLDPSHPSSLVEVLAKSTVLPCHLIEDGMTVAPDHVYVIPPNADVGILKGVLVLVERAKDPPARSVDNFFSALATDQGNRAIGVVLSGTGSDGVEGLRAIKQADGITFAQDSTTAKFPGMPGGAAAAGVVDFVAPIPELVEALKGIGHHPFLRVPAGDDPLGGPRDDGDDFRRILYLLRSKAGDDFTDYKRSTIGRRLARRMALRQKVKLRAYFQLLQDDPAELNALHDDLLIGVTSFFRDPEVWESLRETILPEIVKNKRGGGAIRVWVPGCSTGEEAYTIAILLLEVLGGQARDATVQIFATDISEKAIAKARQGRYSEAAVQSISPARLQTFFTRVEGGHQINKFVRDMCLFVRHNLLSDPPFSKLDLISCRNVLIYLNQPSQARAIATFHFALQVPGYLLVGKDEKPTDPDRLFTSVDNQTNVFARSRSASALRFRGAPSGGGTPVPPAVYGPAAHAPAHNLIKETETMLFGRYVPPGVVVNDKGDILQFIGRTGPFLEAAPGQPQHSVLKMARSGLLADLRLALADAKKTNASVRRPGVRVRQEGGTTLRCDLVVMPIPSRSGGKEHTFIVLFEEARPATPSKSTKSRQIVAVGREDRKRASELESELEATRGYLQSIVDEHLKTNDDLAAANEELVSSNEELQSLNEELDTAKEELQSTNEELVTLNDELQSRNMELNSVNSDLLNVMNSVEIPVVIVDGALRVRRFTPNAVGLMNLRDNDIGRPFREVKSNLNIDDLELQIAEVVETVKPRESDVQDRSGRWYRLQIRPYLSADRRIDGAVLTVIDIDALKRALGAAEWARDYAASTVEAVQTPLVVLDEKIAVRSANHAYYDLFHVEKSETEGRSLFELGKGCWNIPSVRMPMEGMLESNSQFSHLQVECEPPGLGPRVMSLSARPVMSPSQTPMILLSIDDITQEMHDEAERARLHNEAEAARSAAELANHTKDVFLATLSHELRTPLSALLLHTQLLRRSERDPARLERFDAVDRAVKAQAQLIDDLLDVSRIASGKLKMEFEPTSLARIVSQAVETLRPVADKKELKLDLSVDDTLPAVSGDPLRLQQVVLNLVNNAIKFTSAGGRITVTLDRAGDRGRIRVVDTGSGIEPRFLPQVFNAFAQADGSQTRVHGGLGLGLSIARHLVEAHGGSIRVESPGEGKGSTFTVTLPLLAGPAQGATVRKPRSGADAFRGELHGSKVLVVEDDRSTREGLAEMISSAGAELRTAPSAAVAMEIMETFAPDALVLDIAMPEEDGLSLLRRIRALGASRHGDVPAIALTALAGEEDARRIMAAGFQVHLVKPLGISRLVDALGDLVASNRRESLRPTDDSLSAQ